MSKTLNGSAIISYGTTLPPTASTPAGALFYKTDSSGGSPQGLYMFGFVKDINPSALGSQVAQSWIQVVSPDLFVLKGGDTMTGPLTVPDFLKVTGSSAQRLLIGNSANNPIVLESTSSTLSIGVGTNWSTGGTLGSGLGINPGAASAGLSWKGFKVFYSDVASGGMGSGSGLDADKLDGQDGSYYLNASNMASGVLSPQRGGTGISGLATAGGVAYGTSVGNIGTTSAGTSGQVLLSGGAGVPTWVNQSSLSVGSATNATNANTANTATTATTANTANAVAWTGITGLNPTLPAGGSSASVFSNYPASGFNAWVRPSYFFDMGGGGLASMTPNQFPTGSISGFDAYSTSDMGQYQVGVTVSGTASAGARSLQIVANWNYEEAAPTGLRYRVNDDTGTTGAWGAFRTIWDQGNLTQVSQLTNNMNYTVAGSNISQFNNDVGYLTQAGATGGGTDKVFWENDTVVTTNYTITSGKNAMSAGPISINNGVTVTVPNGSVWTIV